MRAVIVSGVSILSMLMAVSPCAGQYTVTDLGVLPGGGFAAGLAFSPNGNFVVGMSYLTFSPSPFTSVLFTGGMLVDIGSLGGDYSQANGVNDDGIVVGESTAEPGPSEGHAYLYRGGEMTDLGFGSAAAINGSGLVVGRHFFPPDNLQHAFLYDGNKMIDLGNLDGTGPSEATAINRNGQIVGMSFTASNAQHAFRWHSATGMVDLGTLGRNSAATAMNDVAQVAGYSVTPDGYTTAVLYENGNVIDLGTLGGCQELFCSMATGINNSGQVVGRAHLSGGAETPFLYRDGVMMNLNNLISDPGWKLRFATAINDAGQIVGAAGPPSGEYSHAVLLTPTAQNLPTTWVSADIGAVGQPGSTTFSDGTFTVSGSGRDIWDTTDAFRFVYHAPPGGFGEIVARITSEQDTQTFAKAGLMIRESLTPGSAHVILDVRPDGSVEFMDRSSTDGITTFNAGGSVQLPVFFKLARNAGAVTGSFSQDGISWTVVGRADIAWSTEALFGLAVTSHDDSVLNQSIFDTVTVQTLPPGWDQRDVGMVGLPGTASEAADGTFTVSGAGADIWGTADAYHTVGRNLAGDGVIVARVTSEQDTNPFAKAGIMMGWFTADGPNVILDVRPSGEIEFMSRSMQGGAMEFLTGASTGIPVWLKLVRNGNQFSGYISNDGRAWQLVGTVNLSGMPFTIGLGLVVTSHDPGVTNTSTFDHVTTASPWLDTDVGAVGRPGTAQFEHLAYTVQGAGADIWGTADAFHFVYQPLIGDGQIIVRVRSMDNTNTYAKAGVMIRQNLGPNAAHVILDLRPTNDLEFMIRPNEGAQTTFLATAVQTPPTWLRLVRSGATLNGFVSADGAIWIPVGTATLTLDGTVYLGFAVTSHDPTMLNAAIFDNVCLYDTATGICRAN